MTENISKRIENAIKDIEKIQVMFRQKYGEECLADKEIEEVLKIAKAEHGELKQYRSIGTFEEIKKVVQFLSLDNDDGIIEDLEELNKYKFIGTVEEFRDAIEKQKAKTPDVYGDGYSDGQLVYDMYSCPNCGENYEIDYDHYKYCPKCGQHMDKSDKVFE